MTYGPVTLTMMVEQVRHFVIWTRSWFCRNLRESRCCVERRGIDLKE